MEESLKYYVPEISDIRVGYECEYLIGGELGVWTKGFGLGSCGFPSIEEIKVFPKIVRTPYLNKEQIEAEGWTKLDKDFVKGNYHLGIRRGIVKFGDNKESIISNIVVYSYYINEKGEENMITHFFGECKSINEFRYITNKLLKIK